MGSVAFLETLIHSHDEHFIVGWVPDRMKKPVWGRPVMIAEAKDGALLIVDESAHKIWRLSSSTRDQ